MLETVLQERLYHTSVEFLINLNQKCPQLPQNLSTSSQNTLNLNIQIYKTVTNESSNKKEQKVTKIIGF